MLVENTFQTKLHIDLLLIEPITGLMATVLNMPYIILGLYNLKTGEIMHVLEIVLRKREREILRWCKSH